jgi:hypothetical protein
MRRRDIPRVLLVSAAAAGAVAVTDKAEAQTCTAPCYARTAAESNAGVMPTNLAYIPGHPWRYGAVDDGVTNCNTALQNWINVGQKGVTLQFVPVLCGGGYIITTPLSVTAPLTILGGGLPLAALLCIGCNGFNIAAGVSQVTMEKFRVNSAVRYTTTPNALVGINVQGTVGSPCFTHTYRDLLIDGFMTAIEGDGLREGLIDNCDSTNGLNGIICKQLAAAVTVSGGTYFGTNIATSVGVQFGDGATEVQGCEILNDCIISGFEIDVWLVGSNSCKVIGCQLDFFSHYGVLMQSGAAIDSTNHDISHNYFAATGTAFYGIRCLSNFVANAQGNRIVGNQIRIYAGSTLNYGIRVDGTQEKNNIIIGNAIGDSDHVTSVADCQIDEGTGHVVAGNAWLGPGFVSSVRLTYVGNTGTVISNPSAFVAPPQFAQVRAIITYVSGGTNATDCNTGNVFTLSVNTNAAVTMGAPTNPTIKEITYIISNTIGAGNTGAFTWNAVFKMAAWAVIATATQRVITFNYNGGNWIESSRTPTDVPN